MSNTVYTKKDLIKHLGTLVPTEFVQDKDYFVKSTPNYRVELTPYYEAYFPHSMKFTGLSLDVRFHQVEQIFHDVYINNSNIPFGHDSESDTFYIPFLNKTLTSNEKETLSNTEVENDMSFTQVKPLLQKLITAANNFYKQNSSLKDLYNYGESLGTEYSKFYTQPAPVRKAIVRQILGLPYIYDLNDTIDALNQNNLKDLATFCKDVKDHLDNLKR
jgi:hypothetical protein